MYPKYLKAIDPDGNPIAVICEQEAGQIVVFEKAKRGFTVSFVATLNDVRQFIGGQIVENSPAEHNAILWEEWKWTHGLAFCRAGSKENQPPEAPEAGEGVAENDNPETREGTEANDTQETETDGADTEPAGDVQGDGDAEPNADGSDEGGEADENEASEASNDQAGTEGDGGSVESTASDDAEGAGDAIEATEGESEPEKAA